MANTVVWADIPVTDLDRARAFYSAVLEAPVDAMPGMEGIALLPGEGDDVVSADLAKGESQKPSTDGCTIYLDAGDDPEGMLQRAADAGGQILMPASDMGEVVGRVGFFLDSEGNRIGVHAPHKA